MRDMRPLLEQISFPAIRRGRLETLQVNVAIAATSRVSIATSMPAPRGPRKCQPISLTWYWNFFGVR